jgi:hypothetical protein
MEADRKEQWITLTEATSRLNASGDRLSISTLSRYLVQHSEALSTRVEGRTKLVDFIALAAHRAENVRLRSDVASAARQALGGATPSAASSRRTGTQSEGAARKITAEAEMRELDLAQRRGELTPTAEVDQAARDAVALMMSSFDRSTETEAASLSVRYGWDERLVRIALKAFTKVGLASFNSAVRERLDQDARQHMAPGGDDGGDEQGSLQ